MMALFIGDTLAVAYLVPFFLPVLGLWMVWRGVQGMRHLRTPPSDALGWVEPQPEGETGVCGALGALRDGSRQ